MTEIGFKYGKKIDSNILKKDIDKSGSIEEAKKFSQSIDPGLEISSCTLCSELKSCFIQTIYGFNYRECSCCGVAFVSNPPEEEILSLVYKSKYYTETNNKLLANDSIIDYRLSNVAMPKVEYVRSAITTRKKTWLDIGCGVGEILAAAQRVGFEVFGIETNDSEREYASKKFNLNIADEYISASVLDKYKGKYGVISLFNVLEHLLEPKAIISVISTLQEKGDNLVLEVPHYPSFSCFSQISFPDKINRTMHPPLHLFIFSIKSLEMLLIKYGYEITNAWFFGQDVYEILTTLPLVFDGFEGSLLQRKLYGFLGDFQAAIDAKKMSDQVLVVAKKVS